MMQMNRSNRPLDWLVLTILLAVCVCTASIAQTPILELVGQWGGTSYAVAVDGTTVYLGVGPRLLVLDAADPSAPVEIGRSAPLPNTIVDLAVHEEYVYAAADLYGLRVLSVANQTAPAEVGRLLTGDCALGVCVIEDTAYVADRYAGLLIASIEDPTVPEVLGSIGIEDAATDVAVEGDYAYVADSGGAVRVISVAYPAEPVQVGGCVGLGYLKAIMVQDKYAYACSEADGWHILSLADPVNPELLATLPMPYPADTHIVGDWAFVSTYWQSLYVLGIANRARPLIYTEIRYGSGSPSIAVFADRLYAASDKKGLLVFDVSDPEMPLLLGQYDTAVYGQAVAAVDTFAYLIDSTDGLHILSVDDPSQPAEVGSFSCTGVNGLTVEGTTAYLCGSNDFVIVNAADPSAPRELGRVDLPGYAEDAAIDGAYAYVVCPYEGLQVVSIADPAAPAVVATLALDSNARDIALAGDLAYITANGVRIVSIADPLNPLLVGSYDSEEKGGAIAIDGDRLCFADGRCLCVLSIADPVNPVQLATRHYGLRPEIVTVGDIAVIGLEWQGMLLADLLDFEWLSTVADLDTADHPGDLHAVGNTIYIADKHGGLYVMRIGDGS